MELEASVSVSLDPRGTSVAVLSSRIASQRAPFLPTVLTPPSLTTITFPRGGFALSTATSLAQPPESFAGTRTVAAPNVSIRPGSLPVVRAALATPVSMLRPWNVTFRPAVLGAAGNVRALPRHGSGESENG